MEKLYGKLVFAAPLQSWGAASTPIFKRTSYIPTLSGVGGLIENALNLTYKNPLIDYIEDNIELYLDTEQSDMSGACSIMEDFHKSNMDKRMCGNGKIDPKGLPIVKKEAIVDKKFVLYFRLYDDYITKGIGYCLEYPKRDLYLGRKEYPAGNVFKGVERVDVSKMRKITKKCSYRNCRG